MDSLFDRIDKHTTINARKTDPDSSKRWAAAFSGSLELKGNKLLAIKMIYLHPGKTADELEEIANIPRNKAGRLWKVMKPLEDDGLIYRIDNGKDPLLLYIREECKNMIKSFLERNNP